MKKVFIFLFATSFLALNAQNVLLFDFDNTVPGVLGQYTWPWTAWGGLTINEGKTAVFDDPGMLGNKVAKVVYDGTTAGPGMIIPLLASYNSNNYAGFSIKMKSADATGLVFTFTIENGGTQGGNWSSFPGYTGAGAWQTIEFPFTTTGNKPTKTFGPFDRICLNFNSHSTLPACTVYMDDITLIQNFGTSVENHQFDNTLLWCNDGVLHAQNLNGKTEVKVYTSSGAIVYSTDASSSFSVDLKEKSISTGVLFVALSNGSAVTFKKVILK